jgi:hypothetical protein
MRRLNTANNNGFKQWLVLFSRKLVKRNLHLFTTKGKVVLTVRNHGMLPVILSILHYIFNTKKQRIENFKKNHYYLYFNNRNFFCDSKRI